MAQQGESSFLGGSAEPILHRGSDVRGRSAPAHDAAPGPGAGRSALREAGHSAAERLSGALRPGAPHLVRTVRVRGVGHVGHALRSGGGDARVWGALGFRELWRPRSPRSKQRTAKAVVVGK